MPQEEGLLRLDWLPVDQFYMASAVLLPIALLQLSPKSQKKSKIFSGDLLAHTQKKVNGRMGLTFITGLSGRDFGLGEESSRHLWD